MKRTCKGCKALSYLNCLLNFEIKIITGGDDHGGINEIKPLEQCPKPKSTYEFVCRLGQKELMKKYNGKSFMELVKCQP